MRPTDGLATVIRCFRLFAITLGMSGDESSVSIHSIKGTNKSHGETSSVKATKKPRNKLTLVFPT